MQSTHFADFWQPRLGEAGYNAIFKKKGNDVYIGNNTVAIDGCATFFLRTRFQLVKKYEVQQIASLLITLILSASTCYDTCLSSVTTGPLAQVQRGALIAVLHLAGRVQQGSSVAV